jgi:adenylosuccinate synthase
MQQLPCAAYAHPEAKLVLGAGAMISREILEAEIERNAEWRKARGLMPMRLFIDHRAHVVEPLHIQQEQQTDLAERIGSTSTVAREGIGAAQAARVLRTDYSMAVDYAVGLVRPGVVLCDTVELLHQAMAFQADILLEGTQGTGLSNITGQYPYVTSRCTTAAGLIADCGVAPSDLDGVVLVCRSYPIRVAGNSGPFWPDSREISWSDIGVDPESERTTVTKKVRRVATFSLEQVEQAARLNGATCIALTFTDYLDRSIAGRAGYVFGAGLGNYDQVGGLTDAIEAKTGVPVVFLGTGPDTVIERESALFETPA